MNKFIVVIFAFVTSTTAFAGSMFTIKSGISRSPQSDFNIDGLTATDHVCMFSVDTNQDGSFIAAISCNGAESKALSVKSDQSATVTFWLSKLVSKGYHVNGCQETVGSFGQFACILSK